MSESEKLGAVLQKSLLEMNPALREKILWTEIFNRWHEIFPQYADKFTPVKISGKILIVDSNDSAFKDMLKFGAPSFVQKINETVSPDFPIIDEIKFGKSFAAPVRKIKKIPAPANPPAIELTPAEISACEKKVAAIADETQRQILLETFLSHAKSQKSKLQRGWHKCKCCNLLCPPAEILCNVCAVKERDKLHAAIRQIFLAAPETPFREVQQKIFRQFPHLQKECSLETIESARMDLILRRAAQLSFGDSTSDAAIFLVRLIRQLPQEKVTPAIVKRTLTEFRFNLADQPPLKEFKFAKLQK